MSPMASYDLRRVQYCADDQLLVCTTTGGVITYRDVPEPVGRGVLLATGAVRQRYFASHVAGVFWFKSHRDSHWRHPHSDPRQAR